MDDPMDIDGSSYLQYEPPNNNNSPVREPSSSAKKRGFHEFHQDNIKENVRAHEAHQNSLSRALLANRLFPPPKSRRSVRIISPRFADVRFYSPVPLESPLPAASPPKALSPKASPPKVLPSPQYTEEPLRCRVSRTVTFLRNTFSSFWSAFTGFLGFGSEPQVHEEIVAVATDTTNKKRRAIAIPGDFPEREPQTTPVHLSSPSPSDLSDSETSDTDTETTIESPVHGLTTPPDSRPTSSHGVCEPEKKHDSPMEQESKPKPPPQPQYKGYDRNIIIPRRYTPRMALWSNEKLAAEAKRQMQEDAEMEAKKDAAPAPAPMQSSTQAEQSTSSPKNNLLDIFPRHSVEWYNNMKIYRDRKPGDPLPALGRSRPASASVQRNAQKDAEIDRLVKRTKDIALISPTSKELSRSQTERKARIAAEEAEEEQAKQATEEAEEQKVTDDTKEELVIPEPEVETAPALPAPELSSDYTQKQKIIRPLPEEWATKVDHAMATKNRREVLATTTDGTDLTRHDFGHILPQAGTEDSASGWLNDEIVNAWLSAIVEEKNKEKDHLKAGNRVPLFVAYATAWYQTYTAKGMDGISRWSRRKGIQGAKLLDCKKVFLPVNTGAHWVLLIISPGDRQIEFLNSIHSTVQKNAFMRIAREFLKMELKERYVAEEWTDLDTRSAPQSNANDCGLFVCYNALISAKGMGNFADLELRGYEMDPFGRRLMAAVLINGGFKGDWKL